MKFRRLDMKRITLSLFFLGLSFFVITGCDLDKEVIEVDSVLISTVDNKTTIDTIGGTLQFSVQVLPEDASNRAVVWSVSNGTGSATITRNGLLSAVLDGTVTVKATSNADETIVGSMVITITNQTPLPNLVNVSSVDSSVVIDTYHGELQMIAQVLPEVSLNKEVVWSVENKTGSATISESGLLEAISNGEVVVKATSKAVATLFGTKVIMISNQEVLVTSIEIKTPEDVVIINTFGGTLQMSSTVMPSNATNKAIVWSVINGSGEASISNSGLLTAISNGTVTVVATSLSDESVDQVVVIEISNQDVLVNSISVDGINNEDSIDEFNGSLQMEAHVLPINAQNKSVVWSVEAGTGSASITSDGMLSAITDGSVTVKAVSTDNPLIYGTKVIMISNQEVLASSISIYGEDNQVIIDVFGGSLQMNATILPLNTQDASVVWSVINQTGSATVTVDGLLVATKDGLVTVKAVSNSNPLLSATLEITITNQVILVTSAEISSASNLSVINTFGGTLQFSTAILPVNAENKAIRYEVTSITGQATIDQNGLLTATADGIVEVKVTSLSDETVYDVMLITISNQTILVQSISVSGEAEVIVIDTFSGTLQMVALILPLDAFNQSVIWSVEAGTGNASISEDGLLSAIDDGTVIVKAISVENGTIFGTTEITISNQEVLAVEVILIPENELMIIDIFGGSLIFTTTVLPIDAWNQDVVYSVTPLTGTATIDQTGVLTALTDGTVEVTVTLANNPSVYHSLIITLSNQEVVIDEVELLTAGDFTILAKTGISSASSSLIVGNIGVSPVAATYITGFSLSLDSTNTFATSSQVVGQVFASDYHTPTPAYLTQAISDMETAYTDAASRAAGFTELHAGNLSGQTLVRGVYKYGTDVVIYTDLTLFGDEDDVWIFQISGNLTEAVSVKVNLSGGARAENVFWQVAGSVAIGTNAHFVGTILSMTEISLGTNATVTGKLLTQTAVTLDANAVSLEKIIDPESIQISTDFDRLVMDVDNETLQMYANFMPENTTNKAVLWTVENNTGEATISDEGLLQAVRDGFVTVKATSLEDEFIFDTVIIEISNQVILVEDMTVYSENESIVIDVLDETLQMYVDINPADATNQDFTWSVRNGTGSASIDGSGILTPLTNGTVYVVATLVSMIDMTDEIEITISNQPIVLASGAVDLLTANDFTILSKTGISATVGTLINGNLGVSPGPASYITGFSLILDASNMFSTSSLVIGQIYGADYQTPTPAYLTQAISDMEAAYTDAAGRTADFTELYTGDVSGQVLEAGVYKWSSGLLITSDVILSGSSTDVFIFQVAGHLEVAVGVSIILQGGILAENIFWQVASDTHISVGAHFEGTILCKTGVVIGTSATLTGKIFSQTAVTLDANLIN